MSDPTRRRPPDDDLPEELRSLIDRARPRPPAPLDGDTRARMRRRLAATTKRRSPVRGALLRRALWIGLAAAAAVLLWLAWRAPGGRIALPLPDPDMMPRSAPPAGDTTPAPPAQGGDGKGGGPPADGGGARWYPVRNRCSDAVCAEDPACCAGTWDARCDELLLSAARLRDNFSGGVGRCYYHDRETCPQCACEYYLKVGDTKAGSIGYDAGTGCLKSREALIATLKGQCAEAVCE